MYRKRNGSLGFSFTKFANAAVPNFFADTAPSTTTDLDSIRRDMFHSHQLASTDFIGLDERSVFVAGVVDNERMSKNAFKALQKHHVLDADGRVDTHRIGPNFVNQLAVLSVHRQKELVNMLFWWEEECHRFRKLKAEDEELEVMIGEAEAYVVGDSGGDGDGRYDTAAREMVDQLKFARERVRMKIRQRPSQRRPDTEADTDDIMERYRGRVVVGEQLPPLPPPPTTLTKSSSTREGGTAHGNIDSEPLPDYNMISR